MLLGIISDTHDHLPHISQAVAIFKERRVDIVVHCGDYCSPFTIAPFKGLRLKGIFGNNDGDRYLLMKKFEEIGAELSGEFCELEAAGLSIAVYHGTYQPITDALIASGTYDIVLSGHTHQMGSHKFGNTLALNPGTAHGFSKKASIALLSTDTLEPEFIEL